MVVMKEFEYCIYLVVYEINYVKLLIFLINLIYEFQKFYCYQVVVKCIWFVLMVKKKI